MWSTFGAAPPTAWPFSVCASSVYLLQTIWAHYNVAASGRLYGGVQPSPTPCPRGMYRPPGAGITLGECAFCPRGLYGDSPGLESSDCTAKCPKGTYNDRVGAKSILDCKPCPRGVFGSTTGLTTSECSGPCPDGKYSMIEGLQSASECLDCPPYYRGPQGFRGNNIYSRNGGGYPCDRYLSGKTVMNGREQMVMSTIDAYLSAERTAKMNIIDNKTP